MILKVILNFFKNKRKNCFLLLLIIYFIAQLITKELIESNFIIQILMIICLFSPIVIYNFIGWKDNSRDSKKRYFSGFCFYSLLFLVLGNVILIIHENL